MIKTKNFHPDVDTKLRCTCGHPLCDKRSVSQKVLDLVQLIRDDIKTPLTITSGGRCPHHPNEVHKKKPMDHQNCVAVDIACTSRQMETKLKVLAGRYGATSVAGSHEDGFVHIAWRDTDRTDIITWEYN